MSAVIGMVSVKIKLARQLLGGYMRSIKFLALTAVVAGNRWKENPSASHPATCDPVVVC